MGKSVKELLKLFEELENKYINLDTLKQYLESSNIKVLTINEYYNGNSIDICLENDRHVVITVSTFSDGTYTLDICNCSSGLHTCIDEVDNPDFVNQVIKNVCQQTLDYKEPEKEKLELQYGFDKGVYVSCHDAATNFVNLEFLPILDDKETRDNLKKLLKLCRENKIQVKGRKNVEEKLSIYPKYVEDVEEYNAGVKELQEIWKKIVEEGIYSGYGDDERINNAHEKRFALEALRFHGATPIYKYTSIAKDIKDKLEKIEYQVEHSDSAIFGRVTMIGF